MDRDLLLTLNFLRAPSQKLWDVAVSPGVCPTTEFIPCCPHRVYLTCLSRSSQFIWPLPPTITTLFSLSVPPQHFTLSLFPHLNRLNLPVRPTKIHPFVLSVPVLTFYHLKTEPKCEFPYPGEMFPVCSLVLNPSGVWMLSALP